MPLIMCTIFKYLRYFDGTLSEKDWDKNVYSNALLKKNL